MLLNAYSRDLERRRLAAGAHGLLISGNSMFSFTSNLAATQILAS